MCVYTCYMTTEQHIFRQPYSVEIDGLDVQCWGLASTTGEPVAVPTSFLLAETRRRCSPNTVSRFASTLTGYWDWCMWKGYDPLNPDHKIITAYVTTLQTTPKKKPLTSNIRALPGQAVAESTVRVRLTDLSNFFAWAKDMGLVSTTAASVVTNYRRPNATEKASAERLTLEQRNAVEGADLHPRDRFAVELCNSGLRKGEVLGLTVEDWHPTAEIADLWGCDVEIGAHFHVTPRAGQPMDRRAKMPLTPQGRVVPIFPWVERAKNDWDAWCFDNLPEAVNSPALVQVFQGPTATSPMSSSAFDLIFNERLPRADKCLDGITAHALRHEFTSQMFDAGVPRITVMKIVGHRSEESTFKYTHPSAESMRTATDKLVTYRNTIGQPS
jgi:integrase